MSIIIIVTHTVNTHNKQLKSWVKNQDYCGEVERWEGEGGKYNCLFVKFIIYVQRCRLICKPAS